MRELHVNNVIIIRFKNLIITCSLNELLKTIDYKLAIFCIYQLMLFIQTIRSSRCCMYITRQAVPFSQLKIYSKVWKGGWMVSFYNFVNF